MNEMTTMGVSYAIDVSHVLMAIGCLCDVNEDVPIGKDENNNCSKFCVCAAFVCCFVCVFVRVCSCCYRIH